MKKFNKNSIAILLGVCFSVAVFVSISPAGANAATAPSIGTESTYAIVSSTFTNSNTSPQTIINGDRCDTTPPVTPPLTTTGAITTGGCAAQTGTDQLAALNNVVDGLNIQTCTAISGTLNAVIIGANTAGTFPPGCYAVTGAMNITTGTTVTLDAAASGGSGSAWIFKSSGALTTGASTAGFPSVVLANGASANNVFWAPVGAATLGANFALSATPTFVGSILDAAGISLGHFTNLLGRALSYGGVVTTDANTITVPTSAITLNVIKHVVNNNGGTATAGNWTLAVNTSNSGTGTGSAVGSESGTAYTLQAGKAYTVTESGGPSGYTAVSTGDCAIANTVSGATYTCTITNTDSPATLHVVKTVDNTGGGTAAASDFTLHVKLSNVEVAGSSAVGVVSPGRSYSLAAGAYVVSEDANSSYTSSFSGSCPGGSIALTIGQNATCTITNTYIIPPAAPTLHVIKHVVNQNGGGAAASAWTMTVASSNSGTGTGSASGAESPGTSYTLQTGKAYTVTESGGPAGYTAVSSADCTIASAAMGTSYTCTITNTDTPATLHVIKSVVNTTLGGGTAAASSFNIYVKNATSTTNVSGSPAVGLGGLGRTYTLASSTYAISEDANALYTKSYGGACALSGNVTLSLGQDATCTIINTDIAPPAAVVITPAASSGGGGGGASMLLPVIGILKVPTPLALPAGAGPVTYNYTVWDVDGRGALADVTVTDDKCAPVTFLSGDSNGNGKLDPGESWKYSCAATVSNTTTNTAVATGHGDDVFRQSTIATAVATVVVGAATPPPLISIVKVPSRLTPFPFGGGNVIYSYAVANPGVAPLHDVLVTDDKCAPVSFVSGDGNGNSLLDPGESWKFTCQSNVAVSTRNVATAIGKANGFTAVAYAFATVLVAAPGLPNTGLPPGETNTTRDIIIASVILAASLFIYAIKRNRTA